MSRARRLAWAFLLPAGLALVVTGCAAPGVAQRRLERYRPQGTVRVPAAAAGVEGAAVPAQAAEASPDAGGGAPGKAAPRGIELQPGEGVRILLQGIPQPQTIEDFLDEAGEVTLPLIGPFRLAGMSETEAETAIEKAYVDGQIYARIDVVVMSSRGQFFVQGEVRNPGTFQLTSGLTLLQAIAGAGGYTDFARQSRVYIIRGRERLRFNPKRIIAGKDDDVPIKSSDLIMVPKRLF